MLRLSIVALLAAQYREADNMTDRMAALAHLAGLDVPERSAALDDFLDRFRDDALVVDKWFAVQARAHDERMTAILATLDHAHTRAAVTAERALLAALEGGCQVPIGACPTYEAQ